MNILLLYADDWTHHTLSSYHKTKPLNTILKTPVLDALAADGIRFTHNCVTTSVCWISRATLYTGQYMSRHGTTKPCCWSGLPKTKGMMDTVPDNWKELSMYEILKENGYHVGHAGKWGIHLPWEKNIDFNVEDDGWHYRKIGKKVWHITEKNEADALRFLVTRPKDKPFFLNVAFFATHAKDSDIRQYMPQETSMDLYKDDTIPIPPTGTQEAWEKMPPFFDDRNEGRTRWKARFANYTLHQTMMKNYYRMATEVDTACGVILEELRRQDALNNTMIIFTTDSKYYQSL
jgi:arylsulfatase